MVRKPHPVPGSGLCRRAVILVDEAAEHIPPSDWALPRALVEGDRHPLPDALMRARLIVVRDVRGQDLAQVRLVDEEELVQALLPRRADPARRVGIRRRCAVRRAHDRDPLGLWRYFTHPRVRLAGTVTRRDDSRGGGHPGPGGRPRALCSPPVVPLPSIAPGWPG